MALTGVFVSRDRRWRVEVWRESGAREHFRAYDAGAFVARLETLPELVAYLAARGVDFADLVEG